MSYSFLDKTSGNDIQHVTYLLTVTNPEGKKTFSEVLHGHDGTVNVEFRPSDAQSYKINANYDNLAASYVADQAGTIAVVGPVFNAPGNYNIDVEVNGIDFDNTFLPEPIEYKYGLAIAEVKKFAVPYEEMTFDVNVSSPSPVEKVTLVPDQKQLVIQYPSGEWQHFDNFQVYLTMPAEMMSGPFTATFNGMQLQVTEDRKDERMTAIALNGTHLDVMEMNGSGMEGMEMGDQQNSIVITATNVIPEFPLALPVAAIAIATALIFARKIRGHLSL